MGWNHHLAIFLVSSWWHKRCRCSLWLFQTMVSLVCRPWGWGSATRQNMWPIKPGWSETSRMAVLFFQGLSRCKFDFKIDIEDCFDDLWWFCNYMEWGWGWWYGWISLLQLSLLQLHNYHDYIYNYAITQLHNYHDYTCVHLYRNTITQSSSLLQLWTTQLSLLHTL